MSGENALTENINEKMVFLNVSEILEEIEALKQMCKISQMVKQLIFELINIDSKIDIMNQDPSIFDCCKDGIEKNRILRILKIQKLEYKKLLSSFITLYKECPGDWEEANNDLFQFEIDDLIKKNQTTLITEGVNH